MPPHPLPRPAARALRRAAAALSAVLALAGCGGGDAPPTEPPASTQAASVRIDGLGLAVMAGERKRLSARAFDARGQELADAPLAWSVADTTFAVARPDGTIEGRAAGSTEVRVTSGRVSHAIPLWVVPRVTVAQLALYPRNVALAPGAVGMLTVRIVDSAGAPAHNLSQAGSLAAFRSSAPDVVEVAPSGLLTARAAGTATITAEAQGQSATVVVRVAPPLPRAFDLALRPVGDTSAVPTAELRAATERWTRLIAGGAAPQRVSLPAGACGGWSPALDETVDHLLVLVRVARIDGKGGIIAGSGACAVREGTRQPAVATLELDADDVAAERARGSLESTLAHELGHALGFASTWFRPEPSLVQLWPAQSAYSYLGAAGRAAAFDWGATERADAELWLENRGGPGTAASHWSTAAVGARELMTAFAVSGPASLSVVTAAAMRDLGYVVDDTGADWLYAPDALGPMAARAFALVEAPLAERVTAPRWSLDAEGRAAAR